MFKAILAAGTLVLGTMAFGSSAQATPAQSAVLSTNWGVIERNTLGDATATLRNGPWARIGNDIATPANGQPPFGKGSLQIQVGTGAEKVAYGNEQDFGGPLSLSKITILKYRVFAGMDDVTGITAPNLTIEVNPENPTLMNKKGAVMTYTSLVYIPVVPVSGAWQTDDATGPGNKWFSTWSIAGTLCSQAMPCSFYQMKHLMPKAVIGSLAIAKGRDTAFMGAVDGLTVNKTLFDFEANGVFSHGL